MGYRTAIGIKDGVNVVFYTPTPFVPGETRFLLNGQLLPTDYISEVNPATGEIHWLDAQPPRSMDDLLLYYVDALESSRVRIVYECPIHGVIRDGYAISGKLTEDLAITGDITLAEVISSQIVQDEITGSISEHHVSGRISCVIGG